MNSIAQSIFWMTAGTEVMSHPVSMRHFVRLWSSKASCWLPHVHMGSFLSFIFIQTSRLALSSWISLSSFLRSHACLDRSGIIFLGVIFSRCTMVWNKQESRRKCWVTHSYVRSFARTAHSFACSGLLASLAPSAALIRSLACSLRWLPYSWETELLNGYFVCVFSHFRP